MAAIAVAPPLVAAGPPGWVILGILGVATVGAAAIMKASEEADEDFADEEPTCIYHCPKDKENPSESKDEPKELPENPDDLLEDGYEETTRPGTPDHIRKFRNPKTGDEVEFHKGKPGEPSWEGKDHWHRYNLNATGKRDAMLDKNGNPVPRKSKPSHIPPGKS